VSSCHHRWRPSRAHLNKILMKCDRCFKERKRHAPDCPDCAQRRKEHRAVVLANAEAIMALPHGERSAVPDVPRFVPGCEREGCFMGLILERHQSDCCCYGGRAEPCPPCMASNNSDLIHVCDYETAEEYDRAAALMLMPTPARITRTKATRALTGPLEHGNGERMPRSKD